MSEPDPIPSENSPSPNESLVSQVSTPSILQPDSAISSNSESQPQKAAAPGFIRFLYNHNPFYLLSACLFVYGLKNIFRVGNSAVLFDAGTVGYMEPWGLMLSLAAVTLLMSVTAVVIVRFGGVWEDARSIIMVVLLMFFAISVSFDELLTVKSDRDSGGTVISVLLLMASATFFSIGVSESLIRGLLVRLNVAWRLPLYLFLILFFGYPVLLLPEVMPVSRTEVQALIALFPLIAGLIALTLIPAIRQGSHSVHNNGTPWSWPMFPWSPFVMIACAVVFRSYSLTISFDAPGLTTHFWDTAFGVYLLVPFVLAVLTLLLEISVMEKLPRLQNSVLWIAPITLLLSHPDIAPWHGLPSYSAFVEQLTYAMASPVYLTLIGLSLFYSCAWRRGVRAAEFGFVVCLAALGIVPTRVFVDETVRLGISDRQIWPIIVLFGIYAYRFWQSRRSFPMAICTVCAITIARLALQQPGSSVWAGFVTLHVALAAAIVMGRLLKDSFAEFLNESAPICFCLTTIAGTSRLFANHAPLAIVMVYIATMTACSWVLAWYWKSDSWATIFALQFVVVSATCSIATAVFFFSAQMPEGAKTVVLAGVSFAAAIAVSAVKAGAGDTVREWGRKLFLVDIGQHQLSALSQTQSRADSTT